MSRKRPAKTCRVDTDEEFREKLDFRGELSEKPEGVKGECLNLCQVLFAVRGGAGGQVGVWWGGRGFIVKFSHWSFCGFNSLHTLWLHLVGWGGEWEGPRQGLVLLTVDRTAFSHQ